MRYATLLSELVYRAAECTEQGFADAKADVEAQLGVELGSIARHKSGGQRYVIMPWMMRPVWPSRFLWCSPQQ